MIKSQEKKIYKLIFAFLIVNAYVLLYPYVFPENNFVDFGLMIMVFPAIFIVFVLGWVLVIREYAGDNGTNSFYYAIALAGNLTCFCYLLAECYRNPLYGDFSSKALMVSFSFPGILAGLQMYYWLRYFRRGE